MQAVLLAGIIGVIAAGVWLAGKRVETQTAPLLVREEEADIRRLLAEAGMPEELARILDRLRAVMEDPRLGGPGFMTVQFPLSGCGRPEVSAQYPNIQEVLYRKIVRGELTREELAEVGMPEELLDMEVQFAAESGGMVTLTVEAGVMTPELERLMTVRTGRMEALQILSEMLGVQYPGWTVRSLGGDLLLTPGRELTVSE